MPTDFGRWDYIILGAGSAGCVLANRLSADPRNRVLSGSSSINGMICLCGQALDCEGWRQAGNVGWGWEDVLPFADASVMPTITSGNTSTPMMMIAEKGAAMILASGRG